MCSLNHKGICINYFCSCYYKYAFDPWMMYNKKKRSIFNRAIGSIINLFRKPKDYREPTKEERIARRKAVDEFRKRLGLEEDEIQDENIEKI